jgi:HD-like signal output (HDOD) protein/FixJ family two-component response regulator
LLSLIVENDPTIQAAIEKKLNSFGGCHTAKEREAALEMFRNSINSKHPFDLVIIDIDMPGMQEDGIISAIRAIENDLVRQPGRKACIIGLSGRQKRQMVTDCMLQGCNDVLSKNFPDNQLFEILVQFDLVGTRKNPAPDSAQAFNGQALVDFINRKMKSGSLKLPPAPRVAMRIRQLVDCGAEIDQIVELLRQDLSISIKLISISNSVAYGSVTKTTDISQAVSRLGLDRTVEVVMSICCKGYFVTSHEVYKRRVEDLWWHSLACAHTTEMIVRDRRLDVREDLFSLALLHDVGKLVFIQAASELHKPKKYQIDVNFDSLEAVMQEHHERFGILLLQKWGYSKAFSKLIQHHQINGENASMVARQVLHQADLLVAAAGFGDGNEDPGQIAVQLEAMGYTAEQQAALTERIADRVEELRYLFG